MNEEVYEVNIPKAMGRVRVIVRGRERAMLRSRIAMVIFRFVAWIGGFHSVEFSHGPYDVKPSKTSPPDPDPGRDWR